MAKKVKGISRGAPSGFVISLIVHIAAILLAGLLVVFTVHKKEEKKFIPPKTVDRPKMKLIKPQVRVKKSAKPKSSSRIVTKVTRANMPDIRLPEMSGMGGSFSGELGGFDIMPDLEEVTIFGSDQSIGNDFVGTFYHLKRSRSGGIWPMDHDYFITEVRKFVVGGFNASVLNKYYRSSKKLYATCFVAPTTISAVAPEAFGEVDMEGMHWLVHYKGKLVHKDGIKFRFWGQADNVLVVQVDGEVVLNGSSSRSDGMIGDWRSYDSKTRTYQLGNGLSVVGDWITLEPNVPLDMEVLCGEVRTGHNDVFLLVEEDGVEYEKNYQQGPILPIFKTGKLSHSLSDKIYEGLVEGEACLTNGPVFADFSAMGIAQLQEEEDLLPDFVVQEEEVLRQWGKTGGKTLEAEFINVIGDKAVLKTSKGKLVKIDLDQLLEVDRQYIEMANIPEFSIGFTKQSSQRLGIYTGNVQTFDWTFGVKVKQTSTAQYNHEVTVEFFAFGQQLLDDRKFILLDRQISTFIPTPDNHRSHVLKSPRTVELKKYTMDMDNQTRGGKYKGYLVLVKDARGNLIQWEASSKWLYDVRENIKTLPVGSYLDETGNRVHPTGPQRSY